MNQAVRTKLFLLGIVISSVIGFPFILDPTLMPRFIALVIFAALSLYFFYKVNSSFIVKVDLILLSYASYTLFCCLSFLWSTTSSEAIFESSKQFLNLFVFLLTYFSLKTDYTFFIKSLLKVSVILFVFIFLFALFQISGLENLDKESLYQVKSIQGHKNLFSSFLFLNLFFLISATYKLEKKWKLMAGICIALNLGLLFFLRTKAVWTGSGIALLVFITFYLFSKSVKSSKHKLNLAVVLALTIGFANLFFLGLLQPIIQKSVHYTSKADSLNALTGIKLEEERLIMWDKTYHLIQQKPVAGVGMGNWQVHFPDATLSGLWRGEDLNYTYQRPHNDFLWILSETGLVGFNLFLLFLFSTLFLLVRTLRVLYPGTDKNLQLDILVCVAFISGYYTISFFDFPKERIEHGIWINLILGFAYYLIKTQGSPRFYFTIRIGRSHLAITAVLLIFIFSIGLLRFKGEFFMRRLLIYKSTNQLLNVVSSGNSAQSFAYTIDATSVPVSWYTGNAKAALGHFEDAQKDFITAYKLSPFNKNVLNDLGSSYVYTNDVLRAKVLYEEAARISPRFDDPKLNLAAMYINAKDFKTASFWLKSLMHDSERRKNYEQIVGALSDK
ncbi:hypothetical protein CNR22_05970 [Sphingobacteriaceae bacterium]|nr:hypothetical protein CNR22_05970 [Sphingobacteriaceae bacterium]